jgi:hypothetical protein
MNPADPTHFHVQAICNATLTRGNKVSHGKGVLEQLVIGAYPPYGFKDVADLTP